MYGEHFVDGIHGHRQFRFRAPMFEQVRHIGVRRRKTPLRLKNSKLSFLRGAAPKATTAFDPVYAWR